MTWVEFPRKINHRPLLNAISAIVEATNLIYRINHFPQLHIHHLDRYSTGENTRTIHIVICPARDSSIVHAFLRCNMGSGTLAPFRRYRYILAFPHQRWPSTTPCAPNPRQRCRRISRDSSLLQASDLISLPTWFPRHKLRGAQINYHRSSPPFRTQPRHSHTLDTHGPAIFCDGAVCPG